MTGLTYELAHAAAEDAANRQMRREGRAKWNEADLELAKAVLAALWPGKEPGR